MKRISKLQRKLINLDIMMSPEKSLILQLYQELCKNQISSTERKIIDRLYKQMRKQS